MDLAVFWLSSMLPERTKQLIVVDASLIDHALGGHESCPCGGAEDLGVPLPLIYVHFHGLVRGVRVRIHLEGSSIGARAHSFEVLFR